MTVALISPYHLTSREAPAMVGLLLAERAVTLLPACGEAGDARERDRFEAACARVCRYHELMEGWGWSMPMWRAGVLGSLWAGEDATADVRAARERVRCDDRFEALRGFLGDEPEDAWDELTRLTRDLLKGGADPGVSVPMTAGLDVFASRHELAVIRPPASSLAQQAEARLGERRFAFSAPVLLEGEGERLLEARDRLSAELDELRRAIVDGFEGRVDEAAVRDAARVYAGAFETERATLTRVDDPADERTVVGLVSLTGLELPIDAALRSSAHAARAVGRRARATDTTVATLRADTGERVRTLVIKVLSR